MLTLSATKRKASLADYVNVSITVDNVGVAREGFTLVFGSSCQLTYEESLKGTTFTEMFTRELERVRRELTEQTLKWYSVPSSVPYLYSDLVK